jgi:hypothetical protein
LKDTPSLCHENDDSDPPVHELRSIDHLKFGNPIVVLNDSGAQRTKKVYIISKNDAWPISTMSSGRTISLDCLAPHSNHVRTSYRPISKVHTNKNYYHIVGDYEEHNGFTVMTHEVVATISTAEQHCAPVVHDELVLSCVPYMFLLGARVANDEWCAVVEEDIVMACIER